MSWSLERLRDPERCERLILDAYAFIARAHTREHALHERFVREQWPRQREADVARGTFPYPERYA